MVNNNNNNNKANVYTCVCPSFASAIFFGTRNKIHDKSSVSMDETVKINIVLSAIFLPSMWFHLQDLMLAQSQRHG